MREKWVRTILLVLTAGVVGSFAGCSRDEVQVPESGNTLVVGSAPFSQKFTPFFADTIYDQNAADLTQIRLLSTDREGNVVLEGIQGETRSYNGTDYYYNGAADCVITENPDGTVVYELTIRDDLKFSDGVPVTIDDVIFTMYVLCDPAYTGSATFYALPIAGLEEYRSGTAPMARLMGQAGPENTDFTHWTQEEQSAFWADVADGGAQFAQQIVDYCIQAGVADSVASAAASWGFEGLPEDAGSLDFFLLMAERYDWNFAAMEKETAGEPLSQLLSGTTYALAETTVQYGAGAPSISGLAKTGDYSMTITMDQTDATAIYQLVQPIAPLHYYGDTDLYDYENSSFGFPKGDLSQIRAKDTVPLGAGPYVFQEYKNGVISYRANENYFNGCPKISQLKLQETSESDKLTGLATGLFDITDPAFTGDVAEAIRGYNGNGELTGDVIATTSVDNLGYGYIGINADAVLVGDEPGSARSKALRKAFATLFAVYREPVINAYYGDRASVINYPISNTSWAAPKAADAGYTLAYAADADGNVVITANMSQQQREAAALQMAVDYLQQAGYTYDEEAGVFTAAPEGASMTYEVIIPADGSGDHPSYGILTSAKNALQSIGLNLIINDPADANELWNAIDAGTQNMWTAAWSATADPDMYQIYHSSNIVGRGGTDSNHYHIDDPALDQLLLEARTTTDQAFRKTAYKQCLEIILDWGVEIPIYQRQNCVIFSTQRVDMDTVTPDITTFWGWMNGIEKMEMK